MVEGRELFAGIHTLRDIMKSLENQGVGIRLEKGKVIPTLPEEIGLESFEREQLSDYLNALVPELQGVSSDSVKPIVAALEKFQDDPLYRKDMIINNISPDDSHNLARGKRQVNVEFAVLLAQTEPTDLLERDGAYQAGLFC